MCNVCFLALCFHAIDVIWLVQAEIVTGSVTVLGAQIVLLLLYCLAGGPACPISAYLSYLGGA